MEKVVFFLCFHMVSSCIMQSSLSHLLKEYFERNDEKVVGSTLRYFSIMQIIRLLFLRVPSPKFNTLLIYYLI